MKPLLKELICLKGTPCAAESVVPCLSAEGVYCECTRPAFRGRREAHGNQVYTKFKYLLFLFSLILVSCANIPSNRKGNTAIHMLILTGNNNHNWQETTPVLDSIFTHSGFFHVEITCMPDTLKSSDLKNFHVVLSNWNSWPDLDLRWSEETEKALLDFIFSGGGFVTFHASTSTFYDWDGFRRISTGAWITDTTWHGRRSETKVMINEIHHPVTEDLSDFYVFDELWVNASQNNDFVVLGTASNESLTEKEIEYQPAIFVSTYGRGNIFHTILGHDVRALRNSGLQTLLLRGAEWAATGDVTRNVLKETGTKFD